MADAILDLQVVAAQCGQWEPPQSTTTGVQGQGDGRVSGIRGKGNPK